MDAGVIIGVIGGLTGLITAGATALKLRRDARRDDRSEHRDDLRLSTDLYKDVSEELRRRIEELEGCRDEQTDLKQRLSIAEDKEVDCQRRLSRMELILPFVLAEDQALDHTSFGWLLDNATDGWVISSASKEGTWVYVNETICQAFRMTKESILSKGWRRLIHQDDLPNTSVVESQSWAKPVVITNRYVGAGTIVTIQWFAQYYKGQCLALARIVSIEEQPMATATITAVP